MEQTSQENKQYDGIVRSLRIRDKETLRKQLSELAPDERVALLNRAAATGSVWVLEAVKLAEEQLSDLVSLSSITADSARQGIEHMLSRNTTIPERNVRDMYEFTGQRPALDENLVRDVQRKLLQKLEIAKAIELAGLTYPLDESTLHPIYKHLIDIWDFDSAVMLRNATHVDPVFEPAYVNVIWKELVDGIGFFRQIKIKKERSPAVDKDFYSAKWAIKRIEQFYELTGQRPELPQKMIQNFYNRLISMETYIDCCDLEQILGPCADAWRLLNCAIGNMDETGRKIILGKHPELTPTYSNPRKGGG